MELNKVYLGDCLELMNEIRDESIDMILCDLPYGATQNKWDSVIPFDKLWLQYERIIKPNGAIVLFGQGLFACKLALSNEKMFRYDLVWQKIGKATGFLNAADMPLRSHEQVLLFYKKLPTYNPQMRKGEPNHSRGGRHSRGEKQTNNNYGHFKNVPAGPPTDDKYPLSIISFPAVHPPMHPTQKGQEVCEYLIKTYSNPGELILDNCAGSGTTGIACINTNRNYILMEKEPEYFKMINNRIYSYKGVFG